MISEKCTVARSYLLRGTSTKWSDMFSLSHACCYSFFFFFQAEDGIRDLTVTGVQTCALPIYRGAHGAGLASGRCGGAAAFFGESLPARCAAASSLCGVAILVYDASGKAFTRKVVAKAASGPVRPYAGAPIRRQNCRASVAPRDGTARVA